ncbi:hypothetical protein CVT26_016101 [Gymnopilus dilepis]|uniref:Secreted protein n=1 Tax=Gymnopilus dilepis TaxID=231916 RepID=A0A409WAC2_9AGAR|nr:hypothetical protein CVT26_016101 [Gymnopilus dilepis]
MYPLMLECFEIVVSLGALAVATSSPSSPHQGTQRARARDGRKRRAVAHGHVTPSSRNGSTRREDSLLLRKLQKYSTSLLGLAMKYQSKNNPKPPILSTQSSPIKGALRLDIRFHYHLLPSPSSSKNSGKRSRSASEARSFQSPVTHTAYWVAGRRS